MNNTTSDNKDNSTEQIKNKYLVAASKVLPVKELTYDFVNNESSIFSSKELNTLGKAKISIDYFTINAFSKVLKSIGAIQSSVIRKLMFHYQDNSKLLNEELKNGETEKIINLEIGKQINSLQKFEYSLFKKDFNRVFYNHYNEIKKT